MSPDPYDLRIAKQMAATIRTAIPETGNVYLFGSRARGDARPDSDFDLLFTVSGKGRLVDYDKRACKALYRPFVAEQLIEIDVFATRISNMVAPTSPILRQVSQYGVLL